MITEFDVLGAIKSGDVLLDQYGAPGDKATDDITARLRKKTGDKFLSRNTVYNILKQLQNTDSLPLRDDERTAR